jgi:hypothetical protein
MICPTCKASGLRSEVRIGGQLETNKMCDVYFDEDGVQRQRGHNTVKTSYFCSKGHRWVEKT